MTPPLTLGWRPLAMRLDVLLKTYRMMNDQDAPSLNVRFSKAPTPYQNLLR